MSNLTFGSLKKTFFSISRFSHFLKFPSGKNISLVFVESEIKKIYPDNEIIVFSLPDDKWGEKLCLGSSDDISLELIKSKLGSLLTPKQIFKFSFIPTTAIGKPDRIAASKLALELGEKN